MKPETNNLVASTGAEVRYWLWAMLLTSLTLTSCVQRTVTTKSRTYSIAGGSGAGSEPDDSDKLKERYASGYSIGPDGTIQTSKKDLYEDKAFKNTKEKETHLKSYRTGKKEMDIKEYHTPEYLTRQKDFRTEDSRMNKDARESDVDRFTTSDDDELARIKKNKPGFLDWLNPFSKNKVYRRSNKTYRTSDNRAGSRAVAGAPSPEPMSQIGAGPQDQADPTLSMDDVKKMLNPEDYSRQKRK